MISLRVILAGIPIVMLTIAIPLVNRVELRLLGLPLLLAWIVFWVAVSPLFLWIIYRLEGRR